MILLIMGKWNWLERGAHLGAYSIVLSGGYEDDIDELILSRTIEFSLIITFLYFIITLTNTKHIIILLISFRGIWVCIKITCIKI